ncbi:MAG: spermidine/putrescine ABC transporter substrate-binding protein, partial [Verrucomicrobiota bacterium]
MSRCLVLVVAFCACLLLGGCGKEAEQPAPQVVHLYTWEDYFPETVFEAFTAETGIRVEIAYYPSNEVLMIQLERGQPADVILPSDYMVETLAQKEMLAPLDKGLLPNIKHLDPRFANPDWDSEGKYAVPLFYGSTGIAYGPEITSEEASSWAVMFNIAELQRLRGRMTMLEDKREALGAALIYLGFSPNTVDPEELQKAAQLLVLQKPYLDAYNSEQYLD